MDKKREFDRSASGVGETSNRVMQDIETGAQARKDVEREREKLRDVSGDGGGAVGAAEDGRALTQPEDEDPGRRGIPSSTDDDHEKRHAGPEDLEDRRRLADALDNERARLFRR